MLHLEVFKNYSDSISDEIGVNSRGSKEGDEKYDFFSQFSELTITSSYKTDLLWISE